MSARKDVMTKLSKRSLLMVAVLLAGCTVGPDYHTPKIATGKGWSADGFAAQGKAAQMGWWHGLHDHELDRLIDQALSGNPDLLAAQARIAQARAARDAALGLQAPQLQAAASVNQLRQSENGLMPLAEIPIIPRDATIYDTEFDASWEIDLFGGTRRRIESAKALQTASIASAEDMRESLIAEVVRDYVSLRGEQIELTARQASIATLDAEIGLLRQRATNGDIPLYTLYPLIHQREDNAAAVPVLQARMRALALSLGVLSGQLPESELGLLNQPGEELNLMPIPVGERAEVLKRRPDVRVAERQLAAATADIGVATSAWFPQLAISASAGYQALNPGELWASTSQTGSIMPLISWRLLDGGQIKAEIHAAKARQASAAQAYVKAVLGALGDAEQSLSNYHYALSSVDSERAAQHAAQLDADMAQARFKAGDIPRQDWLATELVLDNAQTTLAVTYTQAAVAMVALHRALGG